MQLDTTSNGKEEIHKENARQKNFAKGPGKDNESAGNSKKETPWLMLRLDAI